MTKESRAMEEIHKIREKLYKKRKDMTDKETIDDINKTAEEFLRKHNLKLRIIQKKLVGV